MKKKWISIALVMTLLAGILSPLAAHAEAAADKDEIKKAMDKAADYLWQKEKKAGALSPWSYIALAAAGRDLENTSVDRVCEKLYAQLKAGETNDYSTLVLTLLAAGQDPYNYKGENLVQKLQDAQLPGGKYADNVINGGEDLVNAHIWAVLALHTAGVTAEQAKALQWLVNQQHADGSFYWDAADRDTADVDSTGMAMMALGALGEKNDGPVVQKALDYLRRAQKDSGGFDSWGTENPESCNMVIQGLTAVGVDPTGQEWLKSGGNPVTAMLSFQLPDGSFSHLKNGGSSEMATQQALMALADVYYGDTLFNRLRLRAAPGTSKPLTPPERTVRFEVGRKQYMVTVGGQRQTQATDAVPFIENGRTYVPVRYLAYALGIPESGVNWDGKSRTVTLLLNGAGVKLVVGSPLICINGACRQMDVVPVLRQGRTYLPARYVAESFGFRVDWDKAAQAVIITK